MPDPRQPTIREMNHLMGMVLAQIAQSATNLQFQETPNAAQNEVSQKTEICEAAVVRNATSQTFFGTTGAGTAALQVRLNRTSRQLMTVDQMKAIGRSAFALPAAAATVLPDMVAGVKRFEGRVGVVTDAALNGTDPVSGEPATLMAKAGKIHETVNRVSQMTRPNSTSPVVVKDAHGAVIDENYDASAFCDHIAACLAPFASNATPAELARAGRAADHSLRAYEMIVAEIARLDTTTPNGQPVEVKPAAFMQGRFDHLNTDPTRSDLFRGVDPNNPNI